MATSPPEAGIRWPLIGQGALVGMALGVLAMVGAGVFVLVANEILIAAVAVSVTVVAALAVGLWAGAPGATSAEPRTRARWFAAGLTSGLAGVFATFWDAAALLHQYVLLESLALMILVAAPVYTLGMLLPSLQAWAERWLDANAEEDAEGPDTLGTLTLSVLGGSTLGIGMTGLTLFPALGPGPLLLGTGAALILPTLFPEPMSASRREQILYEAESPLSVIRVVEIVYPGQRQPERRLYVNDEEESGELVRSGAPTLPYIAAAEHWYADTARRGDSYLFLGGGAYTLPRRLAERDSQARITVVELDPEVTRVAYRFFGMRQQLGIRVIHGDGRAYVAQADGASFDRIYVDVYGGQEALPFSLVTLEAFEALQLLLRPGGMLTLNAIGVTAGRGDRRFWSLVRTLSEVFPSVALYTHLGHDHPERQNVLVGAALKPDHTFPAQAGLFERWPIDEWPDAGETLVYRDLFNEPPVRRVPKPETAERSAGQ